MSERLREDAEKKWLGEVLPYARHLFRNSWLPSHDISHHIRVWNYACTLAMQMGISKSTLYEELLLACMFHDLGMLDVQSEQHGSRSREICSGFIQQCRTQVSFQSDDLLEAIEFHDDKEYKVDHSSNLIYLLLTLADDMDALGAIGTYRYIEIYLLRGVNISVITRRILENAALRYTNMIGQMEGRSLKDDLCRERYETLCNLLGEDVFPENAESLVQWIEKKIVIPRTDVFSLFDTGAIMLTGNSRIDTFCRECAAELNLPVTIPSDRSLS